MLGRLRTIAFEGFLMAEHDQEMSVQLTKGDGGLEPKDQPGVEEDH